MAGAIDPSFSSSANLELLKLDFASSDLDMPVLGSAGVPERFNRLSWSNVGAGATEEFPYGVIAGGLADGSLHFWNPHKLLSEDPAEQEIAAVYKNPQAHKGNVYGLEFSTLSPNILASGGEDGELLVWDLTIPSAASTFPSLKSTFGEISYVSWNRKVQRIVASTSYSGTTVVWDLGRAKPVISFTDPTSRRRCSTLQWNPEVATQLIVASDDDRSPSLQVWDLRNAVSPIKELVGHTKGVLAMAWCPCDSSMLLTCSKDNQTLCWDTGSGEVLCEVPPGNNWNFDVQWSPGTPGVLSTSSYDGKIGIYNIEACSRSSTSHDSYFGGAVGGKDYSSALRKAPKWLKRPVGATFGFGGTLVSFAPKKAAPGATAVGSEIRIQHLLTEEGLVKRSSEFEEAIAGGDRTALKSYCESKVSAATSEDDRETWNFLKIMFDEEARKELLAHFGFSASTHEKVEEPEEESAVTEDLANLGLTESTPVEEPKLAPSISVENDLLGGEDDGEDFFDRLETPQTPTEPSPAPETDVAENAEVEPEAVTPEPRGEDAKDEAGTEIDEAIERALFAGDFEGAVNICLGADRLDHALLMASVSGPELWEKTQRACFRRSKQPYLKVVSAVVNNDLQGLVESRPLKLWRETLALICTFGRSEDWTTLCDALGARLDANCNIQAATLCYICAGNIERTVDIWSRTLKSKKGGPEFVDVLQDIMEKSVILGLATGTKQASPSLAGLVCFYAELLASQGLLSTALEYIKLVPSDDSSPALVELRERISRSGQVAAVKANAPTYAEVPKTYQQNTPSYAEVPKTYQQNTPSYAEVPKTYRTEQQLSASGTVSNQQYNAAVQPKSFYPPDPYHHEPTGSPSYANNLPPVQPMETLFPNQSLPPVQYNQSQPTYPPPSQPTRAFIPQPVSSFTPTPPPATTFQPYPPTPYSAPPPSSFQGQPTRQSYASGMIQQQQQQPSFMVPSPASNYPTQPMQPALPTPTTMQPGVMMPSPALSNMPPVPAAPAFMPVSTPAQQQAVPQEPPSPHAASNTSAPAAPPATVQTADTSNVAPELKPVVSTLTRLFDETSAFLGGARAPPAKKREIEDNSRKLGALFVKLNSADLSANASTKLGQLCQAINAGDYTSAMQIQVALTTSDWDECGYWLAALKRMIKLRQTMR
jgi:protein transport protein SEC31